MNDFKVFIDARTIRKGMTGVGIYTYNILKELTTVIPPENINALFLKDSGFNRLELHSAINIIETNINYESHPKSEIFENTSLIGIVKKTKADIFFGPAFLIPWLKTPFKKVVTIHDLIADNFPETYKFFFREYIKTITRLSAKAADKIIAVSEVTKKDCIEITGADPGKISVVHEAASKEYRTLNDSENNPIEEKFHFPFILFVSTIERRKDPLTLLRGFEIAVKKDNIPHHLVFVGGIPDNSRDIKQKIEKSEFFPSRIHLIPHVDKNDLIYYYNAASMFVFPTRYEGFGLPPLEAMACGTPVISSDIEIEREILGEAALFFNTGYPESLAQRISELAQSKDISQSYIQKGIDHVSKYSWKKAAMELSQIFESLV